MKPIHVVAIAATAGSLTAGAVQSLFSAYAVQNEIIPPTAGIYTGPQFSQLIGDGLRSVVSCNKGSTAPANVGGDVVDGQCWIDDSVSPWVKKRYVNGGWAVEGALDPTDSSYAGVIGGGMASIASTSTVDLGSVPQANVTITGTTTIGNFGSSAPVGVVKIIRFAGALMLTHSSSLEVPGGWSLQTAADDRAIVRHLGSGAWEITQYTRANGIPVDVAAVGRPGFSFSASLDPLHRLANGGAILRADYPVYLAKVTRAQNGTRTSGNATIASVANTDAFGVGMPVEGTGINAGCTIASFVANTSITLNSSSCVTSSGTSTVTVFLTGYGSGGGATTVGVPRCDGAVLAGRESAVSRLSSTYFGNNSTVMAAFGGSESTILSALQIPTITVANASQNITINLPGRLSMTSNPQATVPVASTGSLYTVYAPSGAADWIMNLTSLSTSNSITATSNNTGGQAHRTVQPTLMAECIVRVTP